MYKSGNPQSKFYVISKTWDLSENENVNQNEIDNVFVIRKCKMRADEDIDPDVVKDDYNTIKMNEIVQMVQKIAFKTLLISLEM